MTEKQLKRVFKGVEGLCTTNDCAIDNRLCKSHPCHYNSPEHGCPSKVTHVRRYNRIIGWISHGTSVVKTNPAPNKRYKRRILQLRPRDKGRGR